MLALKRVDDGADVVDGVAVERGLAGLGVDLDFADADRP
jgi:hypothetical protein